MRKPYLLIGMVNGHNITPKCYKTFNDAYEAMSRVIDRYRLQLVDESEISGDMVYSMEQYRSWFHIQKRLCIA